MATTGPKPEIQRVTVIPDATAEFQQALAEGGIAQEQINRLLVTRPSDIEYDVPDFGVSAETLHDGAHDEADTSVAYTDESGKLYIGKAFTPQQFAAWYAKQRIGSLPFNGVSIHHTYMPSEKDFRGIDSVHGCFNYYAGTLGWPRGRGPHFWLYAGDGPFGTQPLIMVGTHPAHDGIAVSYRNHRWAGIEAFGYYDQRKMPQAMIDLYRFTLSVICGDRIPVKNIGAGWDGPASPAGIIFHRNAPAAGKSCPGWQVQESWFFPAMKKKQDAPAPPVEVIHKQHALCYSPGTKWQKDTAAWLLENTPDDLMGAVTAKEHIAYISQKAYDEERVGKVVAWCLGTKTQDALSGKAQNVIGKYDRDTSDNWDALTSATVLDCLIELEERFPKKVSGIAKRYSKTFGVPMPMPGVVTLDQITQVYKTMPRSYYEKKVPGLSRAMRDGKIDTPNRICYFLANVGHESGGLKYVEEIASGAAYQGRTDLGNTQPGDGVRFKGRGYIQLTGRANYTAFSKAMGVDFLSSPERVEEPYYAAMSAVWFWNSRNLSASADAGDWRNICYRINGRWPANGQADRDQYLRSCEQVFGKERK